MKHLDEIMGIINTAYRSNVNLTIPDDPPPKKPSVVKQKPLKVEPRPVAPALKVEKK